MRSLFTHRSRGERGFTFIELLIVLTVLTVLLVVGIPGFWHTLLNNRMVTEAYAMRATLNNARAEALARKSPVVVCPSTSGTACNTTDWSAGYLAIVDPNGPSEEVLQWEPRRTPVSIAFDGPSVTFGERGFVAAAGLFTFCDVRGAEEARALILTRVGAIRGAIDSDAPADGISDDVDGTNVSC